MVKRKQRIENNENFITFSTRISSRLKRKLINYSEEMGLSQAAVISGLIEDYLPGEKSPGISLAPPDNLDNPDDQVSSKAEVLTWLKEHE